MAVNEQDPGFEGHLQEIRQILIDDFGVREMKLCNGARLLHDLRIDGDDAVDLFLKLQARFGTDFAPLFERWHLYFGNESIGLRPLLVGLTVLLPIGFLFGIVVAWLSLPKGSVALFSIPSTLALALVFSRIRSDGKEPITLEELSQAISRGVWLPSR